MVCATNNIIMTQSIMNNHHLHQQQQMMKHRGEEDDDFDMIMNEEDDSEEDSSQDDETILSIPNATNKRPVAEPLFLNFTSDLSPQKMNKKKSKPKKQTAYRVNGVNILNRNNLDSKTAIERIQRRRENHNHVERRRRDNINNTIFELSNVVPNATQPGQKPNKGNVLKLSLDYIKDLQAENNTLKERLVQLRYSSSTSSSPHLSATATAVAPVVVDYQQQQQSPSAPNSPNRYIRNTIFTQQQQQSQSKSVPSSPLHSIHNLTMPKKDIFHKTNLPPPLALPPPHHQQQQQQLQNVFSIMSVSSNTSSSNSTPILSETPYSPYPIQSSIYIPQPPQLYNNNELFNTQKPQQQGLRPLLPATKPHQSPAIQQHQTSFLPALRMSGYEKIYGNVCRY